MNTNELQQPEISKTTKYIIHILSIFLIPVILSFAIASDASDFGSILFSFVFYSIPFTIWYAIAGGFNWKPEKLSTGSIFLFLLVTGALWGLALYGYWYIVRYMTATIGNIPFSTLKGKMFTRDSSNERMKSLKKLLDDGLISEEEYETKKKDILANV